jgi:hypothetical protein
MRSHQARPYVIYIALHLYLRKGMLLTCPSTGLRQARSPPGGTHYRARNDGHKGLQGEQTQRPRQG